MWIIFYSELTLQHYLYNGEWPIAINPARPIDAIWNSVNGDGNVPVGKEQLEAAMVPKTRTFTVNKKKYHIIARGNFVSE